MADRRSSPDADAVRSLAEKLLHFKQTLSPHERALFAALMLHAQAGRQDQDVQGFDADSPNPHLDALVNVLPAPAPLDPELGASLGRN